jgi:4-carboxymuconolactone decarboxylase
VPLPFEILLRAPEVCTRVSDLGEQLRFRSALPDRLREAAVLVTAHEMHCLFELQAHAPMARAQGVHESLVQWALGERHSLEPTVPTDEAVLHRFCSELVHEAAVSDATYAEASAVMAESHLVELTVLVGYYALLALVINTFGESDPSEPVDDVA